MEIKRIRFYLERPKSDAPDPIFRPFDSRNLTSATMERTVAEFHGRSSLNGYERADIARDVREWLTGDWVGLQFHREGGELRILGVPKDRSKLCERFDIVLFPQSSDPDGSGIIEDIASMIGPELVELGYTNRIGARDIRNAVQWTRKQ